MPPTYSFRADIVFAASATSLCWVDLRTAILVCDGIGKLVGGSSTDVDFKFHFIPLPEECALRPGSLSPTTSQWSQVEECRSMSCMNRHTIEFVCIDGCNHSPPTIEATLTTWTLKLHLMDDDLRWEKRMAICIRDLFNDLPFMKDGRKLLRLMPSCGIIPGVTYLSVAASQSNPEHEQLEAVGFYQLCLDTLLRRVLSVYEFPSGSRIVPHLKTWIWDRSQQCKEIMELGMEKQETKELRFEEEESKGSLSKMGWSWQRRFQERKLSMQKGLTDVGEPKSSPSKMTECDSDVLSPTLESLRWRSTKTIGVSPCSSKKPVGLQWVL